MGLSSADKAFGIIAMHKKLLDRKQLRSAEDELKERLSAGEDISLEEVLRQSQRLVERDLMRIVKTRARHALALTEIHASRTDSPRR